MSHALLLVAALGLVLAPGALAAEQTLVYRSGPIELKPFEVVQHFRAS